MPTLLSLNELLAYTEWERERWHACIRAQGAGALTIATGSHGDGRFEVVGDLVRHIFSAETRYVGRLSSAPLTDTASVPVDDVEALFALGRRSRAGLRELLAAFPAAGWDVPQELTLGKSKLRVTPRKIVIHVLLHEIRHWAQIGTLLRQQGVTDGFHDFLFSPVLDV